MMNPPRIRAVSLREQVLQAIRESILSGELPPGTKLVEAELGEKLGVSRNPVREAIGLLEQTGLVTLVPNQTAYVRQLTPAEAHDILLLRANLEVMATRLALARPQPEQFAPLRAILDSMRALSFNAMEPKVAHGRMTLLDSSFHEALVKSAQSEVLYRTWITVAPSDLIFSQDMAIIRDDEAIHTTLLANIRNHTELLKPLEKGEKDSALQAIKEHFSAARRPGMAAHLDENALTLLG